MTRILTSALVLAALGGPSFAGGGQGDEKEKKPDHTIEILREEGRIVFREKDKPRGKGKPRAVGVVVGETIRSASPRSTANPRSTPRSSGRARTRTSSSTSRCTAASAAARRNTSRSNTGPTATPTTRANSRSSRPRAGDRSDAYSQGASRYEPEAPASESLMMCLGPSREPSPIDSLAGASGSYFIANRGPATLTVRRASRL